MSHSAIIKQSWYPILRSERDAYDVVNGLRKDLRAAKERSEDLRKREEALRKRIRQLQVVVLELTDAFSKEEDPDRRVNIADKLARSSLGVTEAESDIDDIEEAIHSCSTDKKKLRSALHEAQTKLDKTMVRLNAIKPQLIENVLGDQDYTEISVNIDYLDRVHVHYRASQSYGASASYHIIVEGDAVSEITTQKKDWISGWTRYNLGYRSKKRY
jgi:chromosome segregation ATPase